MTTVALRITDVSSARAFAQACGGGVGLLRPRIEQGHALHQGAFGAVMLALANAVGCIDVRR